MAVDVILLTGLAGLVAFAGAMLGCVQKLRPDWLHCEARHFIMAFGGGALLAAVALVLIPKGMELQPAWLGIGSFALGALWFLNVDRFFTCRGSPVSQFMAMMLDFVPESIVVGAVITQHYAQAVFLAVIIAAQNFPEGFTAYRQMTFSKGNGLLRHHALLVIGTGAASGIFWGLLGLWLFEPDSQLLGTLMTFCAGGIYYLVFKDIAPNASLENHWYPSFGAVAGFVLGMVGHQLT